MTPALAQVGQWPDYTAKEAPAFRMAFPGPVKASKAKNSRSYSASKMLSEGVGVQVTVLTSVLDRVVTEEEALKTFAGPERRLAVKPKVVRAPGRFVLIFVRLEHEDGLEGSTMTNLHVVGKALYQVDYTVMTGPGGLGTEEYKKAVQMGTEVLNRFRAGP